MNTTDNPFAAPLTETTREDDVATVGGDQESLRRMHLKHEASLRSIGTLFLIFAVFWGFAAFVYVLIITEALPAEADEPISAAGLGFAIAITAALSACLGIAGYYLRKLTPGVRPWAIVLSLVGLIFVPIGTIISLYSLYLLISRKGTFILSEEYQHIRAATPHIKYKTSIVVWILLALVLVLAVLGVIGLIVGS